MDSDGDEEMQISSTEQFGQRRPPLSVTIKRILERYPDGQIFKEMIQNADDAGAKTVWFYVDERQHNTSNLPHAGLARFQGPALVAANDACFTEEDWKGIQSLQQSIKAEDPFKVGRFGIGFNSVYHLTDLPIIVSGNRLACFEPQENMWKGESGQAFKLSNLISQSSDFVVPLNGLADFDSHSVRYGGYSQTIFRLPLRREASGLSDNTYNTQKLLELLDALREEAKYLLLFLKSVCKIQVVHISQSGQHSTSFCVEIAPDSLATVSAKHDSFMQQLKQAHSMRPYQITNTISFTTQFSVVVTDNNPQRNQAGTSNWLITNYAGSADSLVLAAAAKQRIFPWVGGALELGGGSAGGRIFCFLPMPVEAVSGLPIHVNGTFGLNDDRRSLKLPEIERKNDPTADWNKILVSKLLPPCYAMLLTLAKNHLPPEQFYKAWPDVQLINNTQFSEILQPLFTALFAQAIVWTEKIETPQEVGNWILISQATFISEGSSLPSVIKKILSRCGIQLVTVSAVIWQALRLAKNVFTEVSPKLARSNMRSNPESYSTVDQHGKRVILTYCLSDSCYNDLSELNLLPLANGLFTTFDKHFGNQNIYLCSDDCPRSLLPNLDHLLVDLSDDSDLQMTLYQVAASEQTRLRVLTEREVSTLLTQVMPSNWRSSSLVSMPHSQLPSTWLQTFWNWLKNKNLELFDNQLIVPCYDNVSIFDSTISHHLTCLNCVQPVVYVSSNTFCPSSLLSALYKMNVRVCLQSEFSFVEHKQLSSCIREFNTNNVLDVIYFQSNYKGIVFTTDEAESLRTFLISNTCSSTNNRKGVMLNLTIFSCTSNSQKMYSISLAASQSVTKKALAEPSNCAICVSNLPPNLILFSRENHHQLQLLQHLQIPFPSDYTLLVDHVFPLIHIENFPEPLIDNLMPEVLDMFQVLNNRESNSRLSESLKNLPFVKTEYDRKSPTELFTPLNADIKALYSGEDMFPQSPYNTPQRIQVLISCGLQTAVTPQQVLDIIYSISSPAKSHPQQVDSTKLSRARAVLEYISTPSFYKQTGGYYTSSIFIGKQPFSGALHQLATSRCWLPVLRSSRPDYCDKLSWKGSGYNSHFISLGSSVVVLSNLTAPTLPHLVGSQMYLVSSTVSPQIAAMLPTDSASIAQHVVTHFKEVLAHKDQLSVEVMDTLAHRVYMYMNSEGASCLRQLYSIAEWVYIKRENKLIAPAVLALKQNLTFRRDLEPYVYILPDSLSQYTALFGTASGVNSTVSHNQISSILTAIREEVNSETQRTSAEEAWDLVMSILNWLTSNGSKGVDQSIDVYVPVETESEWPQLVTASEVVYTDNDFMKNYLQSSDEENEYTFMHKRIGTQLAHAVGAVPLTEFLDISEDTFEDAGQHEPLTTRLKNILRDYKDGLTIIKELLQNADDAEATEVNICYDARQHETDPKKLFFSGMAETHGPALIVHNNSTFSEDDFKNITKLAGATKQGKALKIGKFGVGFCSVYHMTDAPSFISQEHFYIFDPTLSYLKKEIKNPAQPGKKTKFTHKFISRSAQLSPYDGLFGFDRSDYKGTMFRLPFRTHASELSGTCYTEATVRELISAIRESSTNLLLFLQHVKKIAFHRIDQGQTTPQVILEITQENVCPSLSLSLPTGTEIRKLSCTSSSDDTNSCQWLVSQKQMKDDSQENYSTASVACPLGSSEYKVDTSFEGEIFCFLPLSQKTGLPVHISSNFAVINNRRGIWTSDEATSQTDKEVAWNIKLMQGVIAKAYHSLLLALKKMAKDKKMLSEYIFHCLWPKKEKLLHCNPWEKMVTELYSLVSDDELFYSATNEEWLYLTDSKFLQPKIMCLSSDSTTPACVLKIVQHLNVPVVDLPQEYHRYFNLKKLIVGEENFIKLFFDNIDRLVSITSARNEAIQCMLEQYMANIDRVSNVNVFLSHYFEQCPSIPCSPDGVVLRRCDEILDPNSKFVDLFDKEDTRFPLDMLTQRELSLAALRKLGMLSETIPCAMLIERAQTISTLYKTDKAKALRRVRVIIAACEQFRSDNSASSKPVDFKDNLSGSSCSLSDIPFLPVLSKPKGYPLSWRGESHCDQLMCGRDLTLKTEDNSNVEVSGSQAIFVNTDPVDEGGCGSISKETSELLKIRLSPTIDEVVFHLRELVAIFSSQKSSKKLTQRTDQMCRKIYEFFDNWLKKSDAFIQDLLELPCVWTGQQFISVNVVAKDWTINGPYLFKLPSSLSFYQRLTKALDIKKKFLLSDIRVVLAQMKKDFGNITISKPSQEIFKKLVPLLEEKDATEDAVLTLPDEEFVMHPANELTFNDAPWAQKDTQYTYVNELITRQVAIKFEVKLVRSQFLEKFASSAKTHFQGEKFGQREDLTRRIQNILEGYPLDITILKELLQNADDAKATKMYIILDKRVHGNEAILSENWEKLQGPALLVWNDSEFSEKDLQGIQELGMGSKRSDAETIGQYGIGFNVVYHLTDCPSFITGGETMCVLDPHCHFVPGADTTDPGRRFDNLVKDGFWDTFKDLQSAYLQSGLDNCPPEVQKGGSLFRFPLRHTAELVNLSDIVTNLLPEPLTANKMLTNLKEWAPSMKEAMLFLNHVTELRFFVIDKANSLITINNFRTRVDQSAQKHRVQLHSALSAFKKEKSSEPSLVHYPLTISTVTQMRDGREKCVEEKWLIQQGVGDVEQKQQVWKYIGKIKPRHGIAAPVHLPTVVPSGDSSTAVKQQPFSGQVFCFLPLPVESRLPVHINGHFVLDSNRRELWHSTDPRKEDDKAAWNRKIFQAIASSYTNFLEYAQSFYVTKKQFKSYHDAFEALKKYYAIFPPAYSDSLERQYLTLAESVYTKMVAHNSKVLAVIHRCSLSGPEKHNIKWCPIKSQDSSQVYFWRATSSRSETLDYEKRHIKPLLEAMGMQLTVAPSRIRNHLNKATSDEQTRLQKINPTTVYSYYQMFSEQAITSETDSFPCPIVCTIFKRAEVFRQFTEYLVQDSGEFPDSEPFGHPLLLTADNTLRKFDANDKVLVSNFSSIFQNMLHLFLHPTLLEISYDEKYFAQSSDYAALVVDILTRELPIELNTSKVLDYAQYIAKERLESLWECLQEDTAFSSEQNTILERWALIPTRKGHLYSTASEVLPVYSKTALTDGTHVSLQSSQTSLCRVLAALTMPFINTELIAGCSPPCPRLTDPAAILKNLYFLSQEVPFSDLLNKKMVKVIFEHVHSIDFRNDKESLRYIKSLPLFENVDGTLSSIQGKTAYKWHYSASTVGYKKWIKQFSEIFLHHSGAWTAIGAEQLKISDISAEEIYYKYIFKAFDTMSEREERYKHLEHIKNTLFVANQANSHYSIADAFINELETLACIGRDGKPLRPVSDFCDHTCSIFTAFESKYRFLPAFFTNSEVWPKWNLFFEQLKLRQTIPKDEFLSLCQVVADHEDPEKASSLLLKFLFSAKAAEEGWRNDKDFLEQVSSIAFVPAEQLPELRWIKSPYRAADAGRRIFKGPKLIELVKLSGTALLDYKDCLWTVKPIIKTKRKKVMSHMGIAMDASVQNVIDNIKNISSLSKFTNFELFDKYPDSNKPPHFEGVTVKSLTEVMQSQFKFLRDNISSLTDSDKNALKDTPCIPVPITANKAHAQTWKVVLVKPCMVINSSSIQLQGFHPFLHSVPSELTIYLGLLQSIGVCGSVSIKHCQLVLELAYKLSDEQPLDENSKACVIKTLKHLRDLLKNSGDCSEQLEPLYLPSKEGTLVLSTSLLYPDLSSFLGQIKKILEDKKYSLIKLNKSDYGFSEKEFCDALPKSVRPQGMSKLCDQKIHPECKDPVAPCAAHKRLEKTFAMKEELPRAISAVIRHQAQEALSTEEDIEDLFKDFVTSIKITTVKKVRTIITLKETGALVGELELNFHLQYEQCEQNEATRQLCLYMDSNKSEHTLIDCIIKALAGKLVGIVKRRYPKLNEVSYLRISGILTSLLILQTPKELEQALSEEDIHYETDSSSMPEVTFELGKEVPPDWHHRLDQSIDNVFHPGELVGYENQDGHEIIFARIMHLVLPEDDSIDSVQHFNMKYRIYTSPEDDEGIEVGILQLYKFLRGLKKVNKDENEKGLVLFEGETEQAKLQKKIREEKLEEIIELLRKQLDDIWKLPEEQWKRAIRRLYLRWHPDKNPDNPDFAEKVFKFLNSEIDKRKNGGIYRDDLNETARRHRRNFDREQNYQRQNYSYPSGSTRSGRAWRHTKGSDSDGDDDVDGDFGRGWRAATGQYNPFAKFNFRPSCDPNEGKRWLKQGEANFRSLTVLFGTAQDDPRVCGDVCFMAHQVAEKALKGGKYFVCGLDSNSLRSHNISTHAYGLQSERPGETHGLVAHTTPLENYYLAPRYPNRWPSGVVPADQYSYEKAEAAKNHAQAILETIKNIIENE